MLFGVVFYGKRYKLSEYGVMGVLVLGLVIFMGADATTSPDFDPIGVVLILASLMVDACIINLQEYMFNHFQSDEEVRESSPPSFPGLSQSVAHTTSCAPSDPPPPSPPPAGDDLHVICWGLPRAATHMHGHRRDV